MRQLTQPDRASIGPTALANLSRLLRERSGLVIGPDKLYLLETRLAPLLLRDGLEDLDSLVRSIQHEGDNGSLAYDVVEAMTTNETSFFRDTYPFEHLQRYCLPRLLATRPPGHALRIWSAGASCGQESYSLAMTLAESAPHGAPPPALIIGTDIARAPLAHADVGQYSSFQVQRGLTKQRLLRHFIQTDDGWQIDAALRRMCQFRVLNLLDEPCSVGQFDVIFCRNLLMYLDPPTRERVLAYLVRHLRPDGLLYLGGSETAVGLTPCPHQQGQERAIYLPVFES